MYQKKIQSLP